MSTDTALSVQQLQSPDLDLAPCNTLFLNMKLKIKEERKICSRYLMIL